MEGVSLSLLPCDLTSATFLEAWRHRVRVRLESGDVRPWLYGVASNLTRNGARSRRRYAAALARIPREQPHADFSDAANQRVESEARVRELLASLRELPVGELETVLLVGWQWPHPQGSGVSARRAGSDDTHPTVQGPRATYGRRASKARRHPDRDPARRRSAMSEFLPPPPEHPQLENSRVAQLGAHLALEIGRERGSLSRSRRRRAVLVAAAFAILSLAGAGYAIGTDALNVFDSGGGGAYDPTRVGNRIEIATAGEWSLLAWKSTRGICLGLTRDGKPAAAGCGMPVVGAPPDQVGRQPAPTHLIGYMTIGAAGDPLLVTGPTADNVARVEIELVDGRLLEAQVYEAQAELDTPLNFYLLVDHASSVTTFLQQPVKALRAYDTDGALLERFVVNAPRSPGGSYSGTAP